MGSNPPFENLRSANLEVQAKPLREGSLAERAFFALSPEELACNCRRR